MRSFVAGALGGIVGFAAACTAVLFVIGPDLPRTPSGDPKESSSGEVLAPAPVRMSVPEIAEATPVPVVAEGADAVPANAVASEPTVAAPPVIEAPTMEPAHVAIAPAGDARAAISKEPDAAPSAQPPIVAELPPAVAAKPPSARPVDAKLAAAAESLRNFRLKVPAMTPPNPVAPASVTGTATPVVSAVAAETRVQSEPAATPRIFARTSTIPRRAATPAVEPAQVLPDVDPSALMRASQSIERLSRRMRIPNVG